MSLRLPSHTRYQYSPLPERPKYNWPGGKDLAFYIGLNVEHFAFMSGRGSDPHQRGGAAPQTQRNYAWRDYGLRVGIWNVFKMLDDLDLSCTVLLNSMVCDLYPAVIERMKSRDYDICGHGRTNGEALADVWEHDEAMRLREATEDIASAFGKRPTGWMGPGAAETRVTPDLLVEAGYTHSLGWPLDDQPVWMRTRSGPLLSVPYPMELNDIGATVHRDHNGREFADMVVDQFEELLEQSTERPLVMSVSLHPYICGQPFRLRPLRKALQHCRSHKQQDRVWWTRAVDIAEHCFTLPKDVLPRP
jgi:allantoinase